MVIDLGPAQSSAYRERGVARHTLDFSRALLTRHPDLVGHFLVNPRRPPVGGIDDLIAGGRAVPVDEWRGRPGGVLHLISPFELDVPVRLQWPRAASRAGMRLVVTVHDLIPDVFPDAYLADPGLRRRWRARLELIRAAHHVFTLSRSATADVVERLGIPESRVTVIGAGCSPRFRPPSAGGRDGDGRDAGGRDAGGELPGLRPGFVIYNGAVEPRKNLDRLLQAWARVPNATRAARQLVVVCRMDPLQRHHYEVMAEGMGIGDGVLFTGAVSDDDLVRLYQTTDLMVFPSLYEGYGLPVVEAQACGAPVMAAATSSLVELVEPEGRFDPYDVDAMARAIERGLTDQRLRALLRAHAGRRRPTWEAVADRAAEVYRRLVAPPGASGRRWWPATPAIAVVPGTPRWADRDAALVTALGVHAAVDVFGPSGRPLAGLRAMDGLRGGYAAVIVTLGGDAGSVAGLRALRRVTEPVVAPVVVIAYEAALVAAYEEAGELAAALAAQFPGIGMRGAFVSPHQLAGVLMVKEALSRSACYLVASDEQAALVRSEVWAEHADRIRVLADMSWAERQALELLAAIAT